MEASSSNPRYQSDPGRAPITTASVFAIDPSVADLLNVVPSTISLIDDEVFAHWIVCH